ncbi:MAG: hypothetical protein M9897_05095 [Brumimicrobium sp.]|nr:hypothetical protein [Brumimicrobium sp.]
MQFTFDIHNANQQYLQITAKIKVSKAQTQLFFPAWRPGRYELGDFAKNVNHFQVLDEKKKPLSFEKTSKNSWLIQTKGVKEMTVKYSYYAADLNAGSTYLDATQLYVNPVNCCVFTDETFNDPITVQLNIPDNWKIAHSLKGKGKKLEAKHYDELADSPFICSADLQHNSYTVAGTQFHVWFNGIIKPDWKRLLQDFEGFTKAQIDKFGAFPSKEYHFLFQILPINAYHGVEHSKSTVIAFGPSYSVFEENYKELLGVSSHELYHTWNIKAIRPKEMFPYDFKKENYSRLGYIAEGVTTYMGDLMLLKGGVFTIAQYLYEMDAQLQKHFDNFGRLNYSVAESSFDTWLDGYVPGAPGRKVSIYTEGCLLAFIADVYIMKQSKNKYSLDTLMRVMYEKYALKGKGITEKDYQKEMEKLTGTSMQWYFDDYVNGTKSYREILLTSFDYLGLTMSEFPLKSEFASYYGGKLSENTHPFITAIYPDSPLDLSGAMLGDQIVAINGIAVNNNVDRWLRYFGKGKIKLTVLRKGVTLSLNMTTSNKKDQTKDVYYQGYSVTMKPELTQEERDALQVWVVASDCK